MQNKKSKSSDLSRRSVLFFQMGLVMVLFLVWQLIEWKVDAAEDVQSSIISIDHFEEEQIPITEVPEEKLPEIPKEITEKVEVIEDDIDKVEDIIASTETTRDPVRVEDIEVIDKVEEIEDYNIISVEEVPIYPGCEGLKSNEERRDCMSEKINRHVNRIFDTSLGEELGLTGVHRIYVSFKIEPSGTVSIIGARGPHPRLEAEAIRVAKTLPEMQPGKQGGKAVGVIYSLPITFRVQE